MTRIIWATLVSIPTLIIAQTGDTGATADTVSRGSTVMDGASSGEVDSLAARVSGLEAKTAAVGEKVGNMEATLVAGEEAFAEVKTTVGKLAKIKVGGYIQAQWEYAENAGAFTATSQERFRMRRARLKTTYQGAMSKYVLEFDALPTGLSVKDANATITEPWLNAFSFEGGIMDRPFGFEVGYSSSAIEVPERTKGSNVLMPGEKDMGFAFIFKGTEQMGPLEMLDVKFGAFTGMGSGANENDDEKDFIGRLGLAVPVYDLNLAIDGGFSLYLGKVTDTTLKVSQTQKANGNYTWAGKSNLKRLDTYDRNLMGVDAQIYYDIPVIGGISLRGEYWWGDWASTAGSYNLYTGDAKGIYLREVASWYLMAVQNIGASNQIAVRYDLFDPNTQVGGDDIGKAGANLNENDAALSTLGLAWNYFWDDAVRFTLAYDINRNEKVNAAATGSLSKWEDDFDNNQWTFRMQVKF